MPDYQVTVETTQGPVVSHVSAIDGKRARLEARRITKGEGHTLLGRIPAVVRKGA